MRRLISCSIGDKLQFIWKKKTDAGIEKMSLTCSEPPAPELIDKYNSLILIIASLLNLPGTVQDMKERKGGCTILKVSYQYEEMSDGQMLRDVKLKAAMYMALSAEKATILTPWIKDTSKHAGYLPEGSLVRMLDDLEQQCWNYIDGNRAQTHLNFKEAEAIKEEAEE